MDTTQILKTSGSRAQAHTNNVLVVLLRIGREGWKGRLKGKVGEGRLEGRLEGKVGREGEGKDGKGRLEGKIGREGLEGKVWKGR